MDPHGKVALITGGARMGEAIASALARKGVRIALAYRRSQEATQAIVQQVLDLGGEAIALECDLTLEAAVGELIERVADQWGRLDILVNMASTYESRAFGDLDSESWREDFDANARSAYLTSLAAALCMQRQGAGRIINFSDWNASSGRPRYKHYVPYYASKAAVNGLTEALALELAPKILVNTIAPGPVLPPEDLTPSEIKAVEKATPLGRWGGAEEIAKAVVFLIESDFITGECIRIDGGRHLY